MLLIHVQLFTEEQANSADSIYPSFDMVLTYPRTSLFQRRLDLLQQMNVSQSNKDIEEVENKDTIHQTVTGKIEITLADAGVVTNCTIIIELVR